MGDQESTKEVDKEAAAAIDKQIEADANRMLDVNTTRPVTGQDHGQLEWSYVKMYLLKEEESIMIGANQSNFGRADKGNPFDAKSQTLSEFNKNCTQRNYSSLGSFRLLSQAEREQPVFWQVSYDIVW